MNNENESRNEYADVMNEDESIMCPIMMMLHVNGGHCIGRACSWNISESRDGLEHMDCAISEAAYHIRDIARTHETVADNIKDIDIDLEMGCLG